MSNKLAILVSFILGAAGGSAVTYVIQKNKYETEKDEFYEKEVKPARDEYFQKAREASEQSREIMEENRAAKEKISETYGSLTEALSYVSENNETDEKVLEEKPEDNYPPVPDPIDVPTNNGPLTYFISGDDYVDENHYAKMSLVYYTNGYVVDSNYNIIQDPELILGQDEYDQLANLSVNKTDIVWIRNDDLMADYEIQLADYDFSD